MTSKSTTQDRIHLLAEVCSHDCVKTLMGEVTANDLAAWLIAELKNVDALDTFHPHGELFSKATAPSTILHIVSGNTPHAGIQSLIRGLLVGSHNIIKLPSSGLPELSDCIAALPSNLKKLVETHTTLTDSQWNRADAIIAIGSDSAINSIHQKTRPHQIFIPHGHKLSIGIVYDQFENAAPLAAQDICLYNQQGCLSPHVLYIKGTQDEVACFSDLLAKEMEKYTQQEQLAPLNISEAGAIRTLRETVRFESANNSTTQLRESSESLNWTIITESNPLLKLSCLNRCVYIKPLPQSFDVATLGPEATYLSTIAIHPFDLDVATSLSDLPAHRICPLGQSQQPSLFWHHDGFAPLASLVKWQDLG